MKENIAYYPVHEGGSMKSRFDFCGRSSDVTFPRIGLASPPTGKPGVKKEAFGTLPNGTSVFTFSQATSWAAQSHVVALLR